MPKITVIVPVYKVEKFIDRCIESYGIVSEIIFNVWLDYQVKSGAIQQKDIKEIPCIYTEKIDWNRKVKSFIGAKFGHKKYEGSF